MSDDLVDVKIPTLRIYNCPSAPPLKRCLAMLLAESKNKATNTTTQTELPIPFFGRDDSEVRKKAEVFFRSDSPENLRQHRTAGKITVRSPAGKEQIILAAHWPIMELEGYTRCTTPKSTAPENASPACVEPDTDEPPSLLFYACPTAPLFKRILAFFVVPNDPTLEATISKNFKMFYGKNEEEVRSKAETFFDAEQVKRSNKHQFKGTVWAITPDGQTERVKLADWAELEKKGYTRGRL